MRYSALLLLLVIFGCGTSPAYKFAVVGTVADLASTEYALQQPGIEEVNPFASNRAVRLAINAVLVWSLYRLQKLYPEANWMVWVAGGVKWTAASLNMRTALIAQQ